MQNEKNKRDQNLLRLKIRNWKNKDRKKNRKGFNENKKNWNRLRDKKKNKSKLNDKKRKGTKFCSSKEKNLFCSKQS